MLVSCNDISTSMKSPATLFVNACSKKKKKIKKLGQWRGTLVPEETPPSQLIPSKFIAHSSSPAHPPHFLLSQTLYTLHPTMFKRYKILSPFKLIDTLINSHSGIARFAAGRRVGTNLRTARLSNAFKAARPALPVLGARYMATEATRVGKVHQVIGAVVDVVRSRLTTLLFSYRLVAGSDTVIEIRYRTTPRHPQCPHDRQERPETGIGGLSTLGREYCSMHCNGRHVPLFAITIVMLTISVQVPRAFLVESNALILATPS